MNLGDLAALGQTDAVALGFRGKKRHKGIRGRIQAGSVIINPNLKKGAGDPPGDRHVFICLPLGFQASLHGVGHNIKEKLIELAAVGLNRQLRTVAVLHE